MLQRLRPISEAPPRLREAIRQFRGQQQTPTKEAISIRLDQAVLNAYRATGRGWQARMNTDLEKAAKRLKRQGRAPSSGR